MSKKALALFLMGYVLLAHVLLPKLNHSEDFLFFGLWNMFSAPPVNRVVDITWDNGQTFLIRDHRDRAREFGIRTHPLFYLLHSNDLQKIRNLYKEKIQKFCKCDSVQYVVMKNSYYNHLLKKERGEILRSEKL